MRLMINVGLIVAYLCFVPILGLFTTTGIYLTLHMLYLGIRPLSLAMAVAAGGVLVLYGFFGLLLGISMPGSLLF